MDSVDGNNKHAHSISVALAVIGMAHIVVDKKAGLIHYNYNGFAAPKRYAGSVIQ